MIRGSCACSQVRYEINGGLKYYSHCHCSICRKLHGAAFASWGGVLRTDFKLVSGRRLLEKYSFSASSKSAFCGNCGSRLLTESNSEPDMLYIAMGCVDGEVACPPGFHEFVGSKAPWYEISDDLPRYEEAIDED